MTMYQLVTNSVQPQQVRETDEAYIIEDVPFIKPMRLSGGYVPRANIKETTPLWDGVPVTLQHARDPQGKPIAASRRPDIQLGVAEDPTFDGEHVRANIRVAKDRLAAVDGAETIRDKLESGEPIDVSSQYAPDPLEPGQYDGEFRSNAERIVRPDSVALLPNQQGQCSLEDGCGIDPQLVANADIHVPMTHNATHGEDMDAAAEFDTGDLVRWQTSQGSPGTGRVADFVTDPGATVSAEGADVTRQATEDEAAYKLDNWNGGEFESGTVVKSESELIGAWEDAPAEAMSANVLSEARRPTFSGTETSSWETVDKTLQTFAGAVGATDADTVADLNDEQRQTLADHTLLGDPDGETFRDVVFFPVVNPNTGRLNEGALDAILSGRGSQADIPQDTLESAREIARDLLESEFDRDLEANAEGLVQRALSYLGMHSNETTGAESPAEGTTESEPMKNRSDLIDEITSNSAITAESLDDACDERVEKLHKDVVVNNDSSTVDDDDPDAIEQVANKLDELQDQMVTEEDVENIVANKTAQNQKESIAQEIVANSAEYEDTDAVLDDYPTEAALEAKRDSLDTGATLPGKGATANVGGDDDIDVSSGVLTE